MKPLHTNGFDTSHFCLPEGKRDSQPLPEGKEHNLLACQAPHATWPDIRADHLDADELHEGGVVAHGVDADVVEHGEVVSVARGWWRWRWRWGWMWWWGRRGRCTQHWHLTAQTLATR
jgi:hypothetical protein